MRLRLHVGEWDLVLWIHNRAICLFVMGLWNILLTIANLFVHLLGIQVLSPHSLLASGRDRLATISDGAYTINSYQLYT